MTRLNAWTKNRPDRIVKVFPPFAWMSGDIITSTNHETGEATLRQSMQELLTREYFFAAFGEIPGKHFLDIGCGVGTYMGVIAEMGGHASGIELAEHRVERGKEIFAEVGLKGDFRAGDAQALPFADETFDVVYSADVFEHISFEMKQAVVKEIYRVLKPGGKVVIKMPNLSYLRVTINLHRLLNIVRGKSPKIYIAHTHNNPDNDHYGLTTYRGLDRIFDEELFLEREIIWFPYRRGKLYVPAASRFWGRKWFNEHIIVSYRKAVFSPISERLRKRYTA